MPEAPYTIMEKVILQHIPSIVYIIYIYILYKVYTVYYCVIKGTLHPFALSFVLLETQ